MGKWGKGGRSEPADAVPPLVLSLLLGPLEPLPCDVLSDPPPDPLRGQRPDQILFFYQQWKHQGISRATICPPVRHQGVHKPQHHYDSTAAAALRASAWADTCARAPHAC